MRRDKLQLQTESWIAIPSILHEVSLQERMLSSFLQGKMLSLIFIVATAVSSDSRLPTNNVTHCACLNPLHACMDFATQSSLILPNLSPAFAPYDFSLVSRQFLVVFSDSHGDI